MNKIVNTGMKIGFTYSFLCFFKKDGNSKNNTIQKYFHAW